MTNNQIVSWIYSNIDILSMIHHVIKESYNTSDQDLCQYIYVLFLEMDNEKLNYLYNNSLLRPFIMKVILNQRNYYRSVYNVSFTIKDTPEPMEISDDSDSEYHDKLQFLDTILSSYNIHEFSGYTIQQKWEFTSLELLKMYVQRSHTFSSLSHSLKISRNTVNETLKYARTFIKNKYNRGV